MREYNSYFLGCIGSTTECWTKHMLLKLSLRSPWCNIIIGYLHCSSLWKILSPFCKDVCNWNLSMIKLIAIIRFALVMLHCTSFCQFSSPFYIKMAYGVWTLSMMWLSFFLIIEVSLGRTWNRRRWGCWKLMQVSLKP